MRSLFRLVAANSAHNGIVRRLGPDVEIYFGDSGISFEIARDGITICLVVPKTRGSAMAEHVEMVGIGVRGHNKDPGSAGDVNPCLGLARMQEVSPAIQRA